MSSVGELLRGAGTELGSMPEARWIVMRAAGTGSNTATLLTSLAHDASGDLEAAVDEMVRRRLEGEPLQYVLGTWDFRGIELSVDRRALIPRPETEEVVACALSELRALTALPVGAAGVVGSRGTGARGSDRVVALDLGTGSGVIALSLALEGSSSARGLPRLPRRLEIWATDASTDALTLARENLALVLRDSSSASESVSSRVSFECGDWFDAVPADLGGHVDLIVSNPPYVSEREWETLDPVVRDHEPRMALVSGPTGREALEMIVSTAPRWLRPGGSLVLELAPHQADAIASRAISEGFVEVGVRPDIFRRARVLVARTAF